jgi:AraC-like DNA-binding protein
MNRDKLAIRYFAAWNERDASELLSLMHSQASYYDAFWQESCPAEHLGEYLCANIDLESRWYRPYDALIPTQNGMIVRYCAFDTDDQAGLAPLYNGAEVFTVSGNSIMTVSDYYCDPTSADLIEIASLAQAQRVRADIVSGGLSGKSFGHIQRRIADVATDSSVLLGASLTVAKLAEHVGCSVMHLLHVLEEYKNTTFHEFISECRARRASKLMLDTSDGDIRFDKIAENSGFETVNELDESFRSTFGLGAEEYMQKFSK